MNNFLRSALITFGLLAATPAFACSLLPETPEQAFQRSSTVFAGEVRNVSRTREFLEVTIVPRQSWKGLLQSDIGKPLILKTAPDSAACGFPFEIGKTYLVYSTHDEHGERRAGLGRTALLSEASEDLRVLGTPAVAFSSSAPSSTGWDVSKPFTDIPVTHPAYDSANTLRQLKIVQGYGDGTFRPDTGINRAEFLQILMKRRTSAEAWGDCIATARLRLFSDVPVISWYAEAACRGKQLGIIRGYADGTFKPEQGIAASEAMYIIFLDHFGAEAQKPAAGEAWYAPAEKWFRAQQAVPDSVKSLSQKLTRGEMAQMIDRAQGLAQDEE